MTDEDRYPYILDSGHHGTRAEAAQEVIWRLEAAREKAATPAKRRELDKSIASCRQTIRDEEINQ